MPRCGYCGEVSGAASAVLAHARACAVEVWRPVVEARERGAQMKANRIRKELLGIPVEPMPEEVIREKQASEVGMSNVRQRARKAKRAELRELMKPTKGRR